MKDCMLLYDLDGTLWDSAQKVAESWNTVMHRYRPEFPSLTAEDIHAVMGRTMDDIAKTILPDMDPKERERIFKECEEYELEYVAEHGGTMFPEVEETLARLREAGYRMAIVSNCQRGYVDAFFRSMNMKPYFCDAEEWGRTKRSKAENIRLVMERNHFQKAVYIGDTERDQESAREAGIPFIHASYGFGDCADPEGVIGRFSELLACIERLPADPSGSSQPPA